MSVKTSSPSRHSQTPLDRDAATLQAAVADLVRVYQFRDRDRICCYDVSVTQCYALEALVEHGSMRLNELAARMFLDKSTTSRVVQTLVKKGYVEQHTAADDRRATTLRATRAGRDLCGRIMTDLVEQQKAVLADLEPAIRTGVVDVIKRLARAAEMRFRAGVSVEASTCRPGQCAPDVCP